MRQDASARNEAGGAAGGDAPRRLVVELNSQSTHDLANLVEIEELNKTSIVNRAIRFYAMIRDIERDGGKIYIQESGEDQLERVRII
jgi:hypothetical protein